MPGYHVFPGGIVEESDVLPDGHPLLPNPLPVRRKMQNNKQNKNTG
jgi:hypothetical protein